MEKNIQFDCQTTEASFEEFAINFTATSFSLQLMNKLHLMPTRLGNLSESISLSLRKLAFRESVINESFHFFLI